MEKDAEIRAKFKFVYGALLWHLRSLDRNWHTFEAAWSDDSGTTRLTGSFSFARLDGELRSSNAEAVKNALDEYRLRAGS